MPEKQHLGVPLPGWTPPAAPGPMTLVGRMVTLVPLAAGHAPALHAANRVDDSIWDYMGYGPFDAAGYGEWVARVAGRDDPLFLALVPTATNEPAGVASLMRITPAMGTIEVGHICFSPALQHTVAASESIFLLADRVFRDGYRRLEWKCDSLNLRSRRAAQRFGFSYEGTFRQAAVVKGRNRDTAWFAMTDGDWHALRQPWHDWLDPANFDARGVQRQRLSTLTAPYLVARDPGLPDRDFQTGIR